MKQGTSLITMSPSDITAQFVPNGFAINNDKNVITIPDESIGYTIPLQIFITDKFEEEFCGCLELKSIYFNENIRRDVLDEMHRDNVTFDIFIRTRRLSNDNDMNSLPKVVQEYRNCHFYRQELCVPEVGASVFYRYHFTNSKDPWEIPIEKIESLRPENQYIYDYAVSKAIKNLQFALTDALINIHEENKTLTAKEYTKLVKNGEA